MHRRLIEDGEEDEVPRATNNNDGLEEKGSWVI